MTDEYGCAETFRGKRWAGEMLGAKCTACPHALVAHSLDDNDQPTHCDLCRIARASLLDSV